MQRLRRCDKQLSREMAKQIVHGEDSRQAILPWHQHTSEFGGNIDQSISTPASGTSIRRMALLGNHVPRQCGIATFNGLVMQPDDKDAALLPRRINGNFALIHRPMYESGAHVWISFSPDLQNWGCHQLMLQARRGAWWDANKVGLSPPLIETPDGWLMIYHGVRQTAGGCLYRLGLALFDLEKPDVCLARGDSWMFGPEAPYERQGDVGNVAFPCGLTIGPDSDTIFLYYGAADTSIALARGSVRGLLRWLAANGR